MTHKIVMLMAILVPVSAIASGSVTVLGLPLGGSYDAPSKMCSLNQISVIYPRSFCWVSRDALRGGKSGDIQLANDKNLPKWAVNSSFSVRIGRDGILDSITARALDEKSGDDIVASISSRFGEPSSSTILDNDRIVEWRLPSLEVAMYCHRRGCSVEFRSDRERARIAKDSAAHKAADAARPVSP